MFPSIPDASPHGVALPPVTSLLHSVRGRIFVLVAAIALPTLGILGLVSWELYRVQRQTVSAELLNTARAVAGLVDAEVQQSIVMLQTMAASRAATDGDWATLDRSARRTLEGTSRWFVLIDMSGQQLINTRLPPGAALPKHELDPDYVTAMREGRVFASKLMHGPVAKQLVIHVGRPLRHGAELYGLSIAMEPQMLGKSLDLPGLVPDGVISILDQNGRIISRNPNQADYIGRPATPDVVKAVQENPAGVGESVTLEGIPVLLAYARSRAGWSVALGAPKAKIFASASRVFLIGVSSSLVVTCVAVLIALWIGRAVVRSVDHLTQDAERMGRGEVPPSRASQLQETAFISSAMHRMAETLAQELQAKSAAEAQLREARDRLSHYAEELEKKVEERTASLREAVAQMEEFSYTVSHDLRSPLRAMNGYALVLLEEYGPTLPENARHYVQRILRASERMDQLTTDVLAYSRVARADVTCEPVNVERIVRGALEYYGELDASRADVTVVTPMENVMAHEPSISQALANLLTNAAKFVKPGERPNITVRTERRAGSRVRIWVEDRGIGIAPEHHHRLFKIFERVPNPISYEGTGVGLAIVRKAAEKMNGTYGLESDGATGCRFWVELEGVRPAG